MNEQIKQQIECMKTLIYLDKSQMLSSIDSFARHMLPFV